MCVWMWQEVKCMRGWRDNHRNGKFCRMFGFFGISSGNSKISSEISSLMCS